MGRRFEDGVEGRRPQLVSAVVELRKLIRKKPTSFATCHSFSGASVIGSAPQQDPDSQTYWPKYFGWRGTEVRTHAARSHCMHVPLVGT